MPVINIWDICNPFFYFKQQNQLELTSKMKGNLITIRCCLPFTSTFLKWAVFLLQITIGRIPFIPLTVPKLRWNVILNKVILENVSLKRNTIWANFGVSISTISITTDHPVTGIFSQLTNHIHSWDVSWVCFSILNRAFHYIFTSIEFAVFIGVDNRSWCELVSEWSSYKNWIISYNLIYNPSRELSISYCNFHC